MATCPNPTCREDFVPSPDQTFCNGCGYPIALPVGAPRSEENTVVAPSTEPMAAAGGVTPGGGAGTIIGVGDGGGQMIFCSIGGENITGDRMFQCPSCRLSPLCDQHFDETRKQCERCAENPIIACSLCGDRVRSDQTFTCTKCLRVAGNDHLDPDRVWCTECVDQWARDVGDDDSDRQ